ncbi:MAG: hypothetical protein HYR85_27550 [Planctomycetes bacterium]|nr:hypothetical protein [Planctomycetota bacterium]MBI3844264.1 hypothetical protein [Planctomycetota bacterium]
MTNTIGLALSLLAIGSPADNPAERLELRTYSIPLLVHLRADAYSPPLGFFPIVPDVATPGDRGQWVTARQRVRVDGQGVLNLVGKALGDENSPGTSYDLLDDVVLASQTAAKHDLIRQVLAGAHAAACRSYAVRVVVLPSESVASLRSVAVSAAEVKRLSESDGADVRDVTVEAGQRVVVGATSETSYVSDFEVEVANKAEIADPVVSVARDGVSAGVRVRYAGVGFVEIETTADVVVLDRPIPSFATQLPEIGSIQLPTFSVTRVGASIVVPDGGGVVLGSVGVAGPSGAREPRPVAILVSATPLSVEPSRSPFPIFDIDLLVRRPSRFAPSVPRSLGDGIEAKIPPSQLGASQRSGAPPDPAWEKREANPTFDMSSVVNILGAAAGDIPYGNIGTDIGPSLFAVTLESAGADKLGAVVESLTRTMRRGASFDAAVVKLPVATRRRIDPLRGTLADDASDSVPGGKGSTVLVRGSTACLERDSAALVVGRERAIVTDYDVEIAESAQISDPIVTAMFTGLALELTTRRGLDGGIVDVGVRGSLSRAADVPESHAPGTAHVGALQQPSVTTFDLGGTWMLTPGRWVYRVLEDSPDGSLAFALRCETRDE